MNAVEIRRLVKYSLAGVVNTGVGFGSFLLFFYLVGLSVYVANALGYFVALVVAYLLNRFWVFESMSARKHSVLIFFLSFAVAFGLNQATLLLLVDGIGVPPLVSQVAAMVVYTGVFYLLNRFLVFARPAGEP